MAEFTRDIKQLQQTAAQQPSFAPPSQSLAGDVVNLIGTGLDFYSKNQAQGELDKIAQIRQSENTAIDQGSMQLRNLQLEGKGQMSPSSYLLAEQKILKNIPPHLRSSTIAARNKLTGQTSYSFMDAEEKQMQATAEGRNNLELSATSAANLAGISIDPQNMTDQELRRYELKGAEAKAQQTKRMSDYAEASASAKNVNEKQAASTELFEQVGITDFVSKISVSTGNEIRARGGVNPTTAPDIVKDLMEQKSTIRNRVYSEYVAFAKQQDMYVSQESIDKMISSGEAAYDAQIAVLTNEAGVKAVQNNTQFLFEGGLLKLAGSPNENERTAAFGLLSANYSKTPALLSNWDIHAKFTANVFAGNMDVKDKEGMKYTAKSLSPLDPMKSPERYEYVDTILETMLDGTPTQQKAVVQSGAYEDILTQLSEQGSIIVAPESREMQAERIYRTGSKVLSATIADINIIKSYEEAGNQYAANFSSNPNQYSLDLSGNNFRLVPSYANQQPVASIKTFNRLVTKQLKAFEELGMSKEYVDEFKRDVMTSMSISPTARTQ
jgi:hypothetical protein